MLISTCEKICSAGLACGYTCKSLVSSEFRYGICFFLSTKSRITLPRVLKDWFIFFASSSLKCAKGDILSLLDKAFGNKEQVHTTKSKFIPHPLRFSLRLALASSKIDEIKPRLPCRRLKDSSQDQPWGVSSYVEVMNISWPALTLDIATDSSISPAFQVTQSKLGTFDTNLDISLRHLALRREGSFDLDSAAYLYDQNRVRSA